MRQTCARQRSYKHPELVRQAVHRHKQQKYCYNPYYRCIEQRCHGHKEICHKNLALQQTELGPNHTRHNRIYLIEIQRIWIRCQQRQKEQCAPSRRYGISLHQNHVHAQHSDSQAQNHKRNRKILVSQQFGIEESAYKRYPPVTSPSYRRQN